MIRISLHVLLYAIVAFDSFYASKLFISKKNDSNSCKLPILNNVKSVRNAKSLDRNGIKSAVRQKLREVFHDQFPDRNFCLRAYDIKNWPQGIDLHGSKPWNRNEFLQINERIPYMLFVPRKTVIKAEYSIKALRHGLREMECLTSATLRKDYFKDDMMEMISERFRRETGQPSEAKIDWRLLDRSQIPEKYNSVPLNSATVNNKLVYKNPEIIDNIHFYPSSRTDDNDHETDDSDGNETDDTESVDGDDTLDTEDNEVKGVDGADDNDNAPSTFIQSLDNVDEFEIDDALAIFDKGPDKAIDIFESKILGENIKMAQANTDFIPSNSEPIEDESMNFSTVGEQIKLLKIDLQKLFNSQHPDEVLKLKNYDVINWPEGVKMLWNRWRRMDIEKIRENMHSFIFVKRSSSINLVNMAGIDQLGDLILDDSMTFQSSYEIFLKRYREESGLSSALRIMWDLLDRRDLPLKYHGIVINSDTIRLKSIYKNPEFVNNIHFFKNNHQQRKRKYESDDDN